MTTEKKPGFYRRWERKVNNLEEENKTLRELLWLRHGCSLLTLYGDDGERQCSICGIDFKRDTAEKISRKFTQQGINVFEQHYKDLKKKNER